MKYTVIVLRGLDLIPEQRDTFKTFIIYTFLKTKTKIVNKFINVPGPGQYYTKCYLLIIIAVLKRLIRIQTIHILLLYS